MVPAMDGTAVAGSNQYSADAWIRWRCLFDSIAQTWYTADDAVFVEVNMEKMTRSS